MKRIATTRMLGCAEYEARWIDDSQTARVTAKGFLPCANHHAQLENRADACLETIFYTQENSDEVFTPFELTAIVMVQDGANSVSIIDALGRHEITIAPAPGAAVQAPPAAQDPYLVYARNQASETREEPYFCVPVGTRVLPLFKRAYGPSTLADCEAFMASASPDFIDEIERLQEKIGLASEEERTGP